MGCRGVWALERGFWENGRAHYEHYSHSEALFAFPDPGGFMQGDRFVAELPDEGSWKSVRFTARAIARPAKGVVGLSYAGVGQREGESPYHARCTSTYVADGQGMKRVQHQQTPFDAA